MQGCTEADPGPSVVGRRSSVVGRKATAWKKAATAKAFGDLRNTNWNVVSYK